MNSAFIETALCVSALVLGVCAAWYMICHLISRRALKEEMEQIDKRREKQLNEINKGFIGAFPKELLEGFAVEKTDLDNILKNMALRSFGYCGDIKCDRVTHASVRYKAAIEVLESILINLRPEISDFPGAYYNKWLSVDDLGFLLSRKLKKETERRYLNKRRADGLEVELEEMKNDYEYLRATIYDLEEELNRSLVEWGNGRPLYGYRKK